MFEFRFAGFLTVKIDVIQPKIHDIIQGKYCRLNFAMKLK